MWAPNCRVKQEVLLLLNILREYGDVPPISSGFAAPFIPLRMKRRVLFAEK